MKLTKSLRFHVWLNFAFFTACVILLLWVFQIFFLEKFYVKLRTRDVRNAASAVSSEYNETGISFRKLSEKFENEAAKNDISYVIIDGDLSFTDFYNDAMLVKNISNHSRYYRDMINSTVIKSKDYYEEITPGPLSNSDSITILEVLRSKKNEVDGFIIINSVITPVDSTLKILKQNTYYISGILILISLVISLIMSKSISRPISEITRSATRLARGEYPTDFKGGYFYETQELAKTLNYASSEISKIDELQRDLIANVSHDLRTPLTMVKAYAEMIRDLSGDRKEKREEHLKIIIDETDRLAMLVNDMLDLSKLENGSQQLNYSSFDINSVLHDIVNRYSGVSGANGYTINFTDETPVFVSCDRVKIEQVIYNLINNAVNYTGEDKQIYVYQTLDDEFVKITVTDTGKGISEENLHQIFDKYYRCEKTRREVVGTGLGLSIVRAILKKHNFPFGVQSTVGVGTSFWFKVKIDKETICQK